MCQEGEMTRQEIQAGISKVIERLKELAQNLENITEKVNSHLLKMGSGVEAKLLYKDAGIEAPHRQHKCSFIHNTQEVRK